MKTFPTFTTEAAEQFLALADLSLQHWREAFDAGETRDAGIIQHERDWTEIRPVLLQAPALLRDAEAVISAWETGDLAGAVRALAATVAKARGRP